MVQVCASAKSFNLMQISNICKNLVKMTTKIFIVILHYLRFIEEEINSIVLC